MDMTKIEKQVWNKTHRDYRSIINGERYVMQYNSQSGGSELVPLSSCRKVTEAYEELSHRAGIVAAD
jgi:hypothetical protein